MERKIQSLTSEVTQLRDSLNKVMPELEGYRNSPEKLCSNIDELYKAGDIYELKSIKDKLEKYHPESKEYTMVKDLVSKYEKNNRKRQMLKRKNDCKL